MTRWVDWSNPPPDTDPIYSPLLCSKPEQETEPMELNVEDLKLSNIADLESQFQQTIQDVRQICSAADDHQQTSKGYLNFEVTAKIKIAVDASTGQAFLESGMATKLPRRKARTQSARLHEGRFLVEVEPLPEQTTLKFATIQRKA